MAISSRLLRYAPAILFLFVIAFPLKAQSAGYFIDPNSEEPRFIQRLAWTGGAHALRYEVVIEKLEDENYVSHLREFTTALFLELSLTAGDYRFRVIPYDVLDRPGESSRWVQVEVRPALKPEVNSALQEATGTKDELYMFKVDGRNLLPDSEIFFLNEEGERIDPVRITAIDDDGSVVLFFDKGSLVTGEYGIVVKNPGGLETDMGGVVFTAPQKFAPIESPFKLFSASWMPVLSFPINSFEESIVLTGAALNMAVAFMLPLDFYVGPELTTTWHTLNSVPAVENETDETDSADEGSQGMKNQVLTIGINVLAGKWFFNQTMAVNVRLGANYSLLGEGSFNLNAGASFLWRFLKNVYVEAGANYSLAFNEELTGGLHPFIGAGCKF